mmetsp:Transcript_120234/g.209358  ORF Transcript_120234/g.209358 Transcript_120234/m.209358 type:complete len:82 (+) Transcript_120234:2397-2642(+)
MRIIQIPSGKGMLNLGSSHQIIQKVPLWINMDGGWDKKDSSLQNMVLYLNQLNLADMMKITVTLIGGDRVSPRFLGGKLLM